MIVISNNTIHEHTCRAYLLAKFKVDIVSSIFPKLEQMHEIKAVRELPAMTHHNNQSTNQTNNQRNKPTNSDE